MKTENSTHETGTAVSAQSPFVTEQTPFVIRSYLKVDLAQMYSPHVSQRTAMNRLNAWIRRNPELSARLYSGRESKHDISFSARQVRLPVEYLDVP